MGSKRKWSEPAKEIRNFEGPRRLEATPGRLLGANETRKKKAPYHARKGSTSAFWWGSPCSRRKLQKCARRFSRKTSGNAKDVLEQKVHAKKATRSWRNKITTSEPFVEGQPGNGLSFSSANHTVPGAYGSRNEKCTGEQL